MCTNFDLYRICACIFNSRRIYAQDLHSNFLTCIGYVHEFYVTWDWCLHIQFSEDMCTTLTCTRSVLAFSIPIGYVHKIYILTFLTIFG